MPTPGERMQIYEDQLKAEQEQPQVNPTDELVKKLYGMKVPEPVFDQDKADRLQKMGRINQVGRSLNVLGDIFGTAIGANTRRRQPDSTAPALYQSYQANLDKYKAEKDANILRDYDKDRQDIVYGIGRADRQEGIDISQKRFEAEQKVKEAQRELEWKKYLAGLTQKERDAAERSRHNKVSEGLSGAKLKIEEEKLKQTQDKPFDPVQVKDKFGNSVKLDQGQWDNLYQSAMRDSEFTNGNLKAEISKYKDLPDGGVKQIARAYHDYNLQKEYKANEKAALDQRRKEQSAPKAQFNPDKAKKFKSVPQGGF